MYSKTTSSIKSLALFMMPNSFFLLYRFFEIVTNGSCFFIMANLRFSFYFHHMKSKKWRIFLSKIVIWISSCPLYSLLHRWCSRCQQVNVFKEAFKIQPIVIKCLLCLRDCSRQLPLFILQSSRDRYLSIHRTYLHCLWVVRTLYAFCTVC